MIRSAAMAAFGISLATLSQFPAQTQTFETSTVRLSPASARRYSFGYVGTREFAAKNHTLRECVAFTYDINPALVLGGPAWLDSARYDITGLVPGDTRPPANELLFMFQSLLEDRFKLAVHRAQKEEPVYRLVLGDSDLKLKEDTSNTEQGALFFNPEQSDPRALVLPARNASMAGFASLLQRSVLNQPVVDRTGLSGRYDFDLEWKIDGTKVDWPLKPNEKPSDKPDIFTAVQQLGLKLEPANESIDVIVIDHVERLDAN